MKKLLIPLLLVVLCAGYYGVWRVTASNEKALLAASIETSNRTNPYVSLAYEELKVGGFPFHYQVDILRPQMTIKAGSYLKEKLPPDTEGDQKPWPEDEWVSTLQLGDRIRAQSNILQSTFTLTLHGDITSTDTVGTYTATSLGTLNPESRLTTRLNKPLLLSLLGGSATPEAFLAAIVHDIELHLLDVKWTDQRSHETLSRVPELRFMLRPENAAQSVRLEVGITDAEHTASMDKRLAENPYIPLLLSRYGYGESARFSEQGKSSLQLALTAPATTENTSASFALDTLDYHDDLVTFKASGTGSIESFENAALKSLAVKLTASSAASEKGYLAQQRNFEAVLEHLAHDSSLEASDPQVVALVRAIEQSPDKGAFMTPKFHEMGEITADVDLLYTSNETGSTRTLTLTNVSLKAAPYSLGVKGEVKTEGMPIPSGSVAITLSQYPALLTDLGAYAMNLTSLLNRYDPDTFYFQVTDEFTAAVKSFLEAISDTPDKTGDTLTITVASKPASLLPDVGTLTGQDAAQLFADRIMPFFAPPPLAPGNYTCNCTRATIPCFTKDITRTDAAIEKTYEQGTQHTDVPLEKVLALYGPRRTGLEATGWECRLQRKAEPQQQPAAIDTPSPAMPASTPEEYEALFKATLPLAEQGNVDAQYELGILYVKGLGTQKDANKGLYWLDKAAKAGSQKAVEAVAKMGAEPIPGQDPSAH